MSKNKNVEEKESIQDKAMEQGGETAQKMNEGQAATEEETAAAPEEETDPAKELADAQTQLAEMKDKYLRQVAEFDNYRKRTIKEKTELILNGGEKVICSLLPILDDFERAEKNLNEAKDIKALREGVDLIYQKFQKALESNGLKKMDTKEQDFNTDFHEAVAMIPAQKDEQKGKVIDCVQTGYFLNDKVIRHAKVAIGQ